MVEVPFGTQKIASTPFFTDRSAEVRRVLQVMESADRLVVYGERRMGKTSLVARAAERLEGKKGVVLRADAWGAKSFDDINTKLLECVPRSWLLGDKLGVLFSVMRSMVVLSTDDEGRPMLQLSGPARDPTQPQVRFERILRALDRIAVGHDRPIAVWLDEFQRIEKAVGEGSVGFVRGLVQETPNLAYVLSGSIVGLIQTLIGPRGPLHGIDRIEIGPMDPDHLTTWIQDRMRTHGVRASRAAAHRIWERAGPVTEYVVKLAKDVFRLAQSSGEADEAVVDQAFGEVVADFAGSFELIWAELSSTKQQVLRAVAAEESQVTSGDVIQRYGLGSSGTASWAIGELIADAHLAPGKPYRISNPFFKDWIRRMA
jgi:hypothetical protein